MRKLVLDTETTGLNKGRNDEALSMAIIDYDTGEVLFDELIKPKLITSWNNSHIHGIYPEQVADKLTFEQYYASGLCELLTDARIYIYNSDYDMRILFNMFTAASLPLIPLVSVCIMRAYADIEHGGTWRKLTDAADEVGYRWPLDWRPHGARAYATAARAVAHYLDRTVVGWDTLLF